MLNLKIQRRKNQQEEFSRTVQIPSLYRLKKKRGRNQLRKGISEKMKILDANMILRYLINDNTEMADYVENLIEKNEVIVLPEVIAEVVYVMTKVYKRDRSDIAKGIITFLETDNIKTNCGNVIKKGLQLYDENNLDIHRRI